MQVEEAEKLLKEVEEELIQIDNVINIFNLVSKSYLSDLRNKYPIAYKKVFEGYESSMKYLEKKKSALELKQKEYKIEIEGLPPESIDDNWWSVDWRNVDLDSIELTEIEMFEARKAADYNIKQFGVRKFGTASYLEREIEQQIVFKKMCKYAKMQKNGSDSEEQTFEALVLTQTVEEQDEYVVALD